MDEQKFQDWVATLPETTKEKKLMLAEDYEHKRDRYVFFDEKPHVYSIWNPVTSKPLENLISVTTLVHTYFPKFDADEVIAKNMANWQKKPENKYYGKTAEEIKKGWADSGMIASAEGTELHKRIELFYNGVNYDDFCAAEAKSDVHGKTSESKDPVEMMDCGDEGKSSKVTATAPPSSRVELLFKVSRRRGGEEFMAPLQE